MSGSEIVFGVVVVLLAATCIVAFAWGQILAQSNRREMGRLVASGVLTPTEARMIETSCRTGLPLPPDFLSRWDDQK